MSCRLLNMSLILSPILRAIIGSSQKIAICIKAIEVKVCVIFGAFWNQATLYFKDIKF